MVVQGIVLEFTLPGRCAEREGGKDFGTVENEIAAPKRVKGTPRDLSLPAFFRRRVIHFVRRARVPLRHVTCRSFYAGTIYLHKSGAVPRRTKFPAISLEVYQGFLSIRRGVHSPRGAKSGSSNTLGGRE